MIKIFVNGLEVITLEATMDLRLGRKITFLGTEYVIQDIESTTTEIKVYLVHEKDFKFKVRNDAIGITVGNNSPIFQSKRNPFL